MLYGRMLPETSVSFILWFDVQVEQNYHTSITELCKIACGSIPLSGCNSHGSLSVIHD
jgi:hypothetical protein